LTFSGGPDEGLGALVVLGEVAIDRGPEVDERVEGAALQVAAIAEEGLNGVDPRAVDQLAERQGALDGIEEAHELLLPVPRDKLTGDASVEEW
jgi:hypothetical protein